MGAGGRGESCRRAEEGVLHEIAWCRTYVGGAGVCVAYVYDYL